MSLAKASRACLAVTRVQIWRAGADENSRVRQRTADDFNSFARHGVPDFSAPRRRSARAHSLTAVDRTSRFLGGFATSLSPARARAPPASRASSRAAAWCFTTL